MAYSDCPQVDALTRRLVETYKNMDDSEISAPWKSDGGGVTSDVHELHDAIMEHKMICSLCKRIAKTTFVSVGSRRVA